MSVFTPASCVAALLALGSWRESWLDARDPWYICGIGVCIAIFLSTVLYLWINRKNKKRRK